MTEAQNILPCYKAVMKDGPVIASLASIIGDPARANMLAALMSGKALTAGELAREAGVMPQTASGHLARMTDAGLLFVEVQGRHRYYRLAGPDIAETIETLMGLASRLGHIRTQPGPRNPALRRARICYDHLAGELGAAMHDAFVAQGLLVATPNGLGLSPEGRRRFVAEGIDVNALEEKRRPLCKACLDWSERRHHLAGSLGAAITQVILSRGWARRDSGSRAVLFSATGEKAFAAFLAEGKYEAAKRKASVS
ncbi:MAG: ArsR/SmtB family transcription factor [Beijerinckiaceae bacterium]